MKRFLFIIFSCLSTFSFSHAQSVGLKTNILYLSSSTPNLGMEFSLTPKSTLSLVGGYNALNYPSQIRHGVRINSKLHHWLVMPEYKYWFCRSFERHYLGVHAVYSKFNVGGISFIDKLSDDRYEGDFYGGGISWGYQWAFGDRWGLEFSLGLGYLHFNYKKYQCGACGDYKGKYKRNYVGPTKAAISLIYYVK